MDALTLALDWTPNTNHTGFFVALERGFYAERGIALSVHSPAQDAYAITPAQRLADGAADVAVVPSESVLSMATKATPVHLRAVAALLQEDLSAVVALRSSGIARPADLDGRTYASYRARYEDEVVRAMVRRDGGAGSLVVSYPEKLGIWETLLTGTADATWVFSAWEGVAAEGAGLELASFAPTAFGIPYGYSPVLAARDADVQAARGPLERFLAATRDGFAVAAADPEAATAALRPHVPAADLAAIDLHESQRRVAAGYGVGEGWGRMEPGRWRAWVDWLGERGLIEGTVDPADLFTNELLEPAP